MLLLGTLKLCFQVHKECHMHCGGNWWHQNTIPSEQRQILLEGTNLMLYNINQRVLVILTDVITIDLYF